MPYPVAASKSSVRTGLAREVARCATDERSQVIWSRSGRTLFFIDRPSQDASDRVVKFDLASGRRAEFSLWRAAWDRTISWCFSRRVADRRCSPFRLPRLRWLTNRQ